MKKYTLGLLSVVVLGAAIFYLTSIPTGPDATQVATTTAQTTTATTTVATKTPVVVERQSTTTTSVATSTKPASNEKSYTAYITGYGWPDNTPRGSASVSNPRIHQVAAGTGTYADPITLAVGHSYATGVDVLDYKAGTIFYLPYLRKYFIVEDTCGDGATPELGPCHTGYEGHPWLDLWVGGQFMDERAVYDCQTAITGLYKVIENPIATYPTVAGEIASANGCAKLFN